MTIEGFLVIALLLIAGGIAARVLLPKVRIEPGRVIRGTEFSDQKLRQAAMKAVRETDISNQPREIAQGLLEDVARHAIAKEYASLFKGLEVEVTETWPQVTCIISGNIAVLEIWIGHTLDRNGIEPCNVEIKRAAPLKLDGRRPIREAYEAPRTPPPKDTAPTPMAATRKPVAPAPAPPMAKPAPKKRTLS